MSLSRRAARAAGLALVVVGAVACAPGPPELVALHGCGVEQREDFSGLRVVVRGDFPPSESSELLLAPGGSGAFGKLPAGARAITVEGLIGDFSAAVGRTRGVADDQLVAYFAPPNSLCSVVSGVAFREQGGAAVGANGQLLLAGGRNETGNPLDELVRIDLEFESTQLLGSRLPAPTVGQSLHAIDDSRFLMIGGARASGRWFSTLEIDLAREDGDQVAPPIPLEIGGQPRGIAYAGASVVPDGRIFVAGGCETIAADARCETAPSPAAAKVSALAFWIDPSSLEVERAPNLAGARHEATVLAGRDGVVYVVGGTDGEGQPVRTIERLPVDAGGWDILAEDVAPVAGAALLEDGLLVLAHTDGSVSWTSDEATGTLELGQMLPAATRRPMTHVSGEQVLADGWLLPVGSTAGEGASALDLEEETGAGVGPAQRFGSALLPLRDGTVLLVGGRSRLGEVAAPFLARVRPALDGPDEKVPDVALPDPDAFVSNPPGAGIVGDKRLELAAGGQIEEFPAARVHVRGFRSGHFGFDFDIQGEARVHVLLLQGAMQGLSLRLDPDGVVARWRGADGEVSAADCEMGRDPVLDGSESFRLDVSTAAITLEQAGEAVASCTGLSGPEAAVGFGVSGQGTVSIRRMRLRRR